MARLGPIDMKPIGDRGSTMTTSPISNVEPAHIPSQTAAWLGFIAICARKMRLILWVGSTGLLLAACSPRVAIEAPSEPITINLNIKIEQEVRIRVERDLDQLFKSEKNIF